MQSQEFHELRLQCPEPLYPNSPVRFDLDRLVIEAVYGDQLSAYRAKRLWGEAFEGQFLLDVEHDFRLEVTSDLNDRKFRLSCEFLSACGRYAFWRLTHNQAPEIQYLVETAHIPSTPLRLPVPIDGPIDGSHHLPTVFGGGWPVEPSHTFSIKAVFSRFLMWCREKGR